MRVSGREYNASGRKLECVSVCGVRGGSVSVFLRVFR